MVIIQKSSNNKRSEGVEKREPFYATCGKVNWHSHYGEEYGSSLKN